MIRTKSITFIFLFFICLSLTISAGFAAAADMDGWEADSDYNQLYNLSESDSFRGTVEDIVEMVPMEGMSPAVALMVRDDGDDVIEVHLGPEWFVRNHGIRVGYRIKIRGVWAELDDREIFMASKIKWGENGEESYKVRLTSDGTPFWTMTPEQLAAEREDD